MSDNDAGGAGAAGAAGDAGTLPGSPTDPQTAIRKRSVKIAGHSTSLSLEGVFWDALKEVAAARNLSLNALIEEIDRGRGANLSSAVRVYLLHHYRDRVATAASPRDPSAGS